MASWETADSGPPLGFPEGQEAAAVFPSRGLGLLGWNLATQAHGLRGPSGRLLGVPAHLGCGNGEGCGPVEEGPCRPKPSHPSTLYTPNP